MDLKAEFIKQSLKKILITQFTAFVSVYVLSLLLSAPHVLEVLPH